MRVAMYYNNNDVRLEEMPIPAIGRGEIRGKGHRERHLRERRPGMVPHPEGAHRPGA